MTVQLLVATMNQSDDSLVEKMNIFTDTIVINQCEKTSFHEFVYNGHRVEWYDCAERGVGKSRNKALMAANADICVFADDDMVYETEALSAVINEFELLTDAAIVAFYVKNVNRVRDRRRLHTWNAFKYGTYCLGIRRDAILRARISFSLLFGGGAQFSCGEDTLFIADCLKKRLKMYETPNCLGTNLCGKSTWFSGYNRKFFVDRGVLFYSMNPRLAYIYCIRYAMLKYKRYGAEASRRQALEWLFEGVRYGKGK